MAEVPTFLRGALTVGLGGNTMTCHFHSHLAS